MSRFGKLVRYWPAGVVLAVGLAVAGWLGATGDDTGRIGWACGAVGVAAGIVIAAISGREAGPREEK